MKRIRRKVKKKPVAILVCSIILIIVLSIFAYKTIKELNYRKTLEYKLLTVGYSIDEYKLLERKTNEEFMTSLLDKEYDKMYIDILKETYYLKDKINDYIEYYENNLNTKSKDVVAIVNVGADKDWYSNIKDTDLSKDNLMINNKTYKLPSDYEAEDLVEVSNWYAYGNQKLRQEAYDKFKQMFNAAKEENITIIINSAYRSYEAQEKLYNNYIRDYGKEYTEAYAARAGHSEHQTGLTVDVTTYGVADADNFDKTEVFEWLQNHAHEYGFILRYPKDKEYLTGYSYESWHYRYVGVEAATIIHDSDITFDEYYAYYIENA